MRGFGVEVWFDQSELRGGDAWDQKIRGQIKDCTLFLPVISAHTESRGEGYFRLEWKLADERTGLIAKGVPFLVPVVVDDTADADALVPDSFRAVQWTRLPDGAPTPEFVAQVKRLLEAPRRASDGGRGRRTPPSGEACEIPAGFGDPALQSQRVGRRVPAAAWIAAVAVIAVAGLLWRQQRDPASAVAPNAGAGTRPPTAEKSVAPAVPAVNEKSIAVIPFDNRSAEKDNAYFTDGIHDDILTSLSNLRELHVVSRTSVMEYRGTTKKIPQIAKELGVAFVLEGSVQRVGNSVHITGQLIRAANEGHVWAKNYDRELTAANIFAIQSELAQAIASELKAAISPQEKTQLERAPTANLAAYELYAKGREIFYARGNDIAGMFAEATPLWERAVELDPNFAEAWGILSDAYGLAYNRGIGPPDGKAKAYDAIQTALRLAPNNASVILWLARYYTLVEGDYARALAESERAAKLSPNSADLYDTLVSIYNRQGRGADAMAAARKAYALDPRSASHARTVGVQLFYSQRYAEAEEVLQQALALQPDSLDAGAMLATIPLWTRGSTREWDAWLASVPSPSRTNQTFQTLRLQITAAKGDAAEYVKLVASYQRESRAGFGYPFALMLAGETERARTVAAQVRDEQLVIVGRDPNDASAWSRLAFAYAALGEKSAAMEAADKSVERAEPRVALARLRRAQLLAWIGRIDEAVTELAQVWWQPIGANRDALTHFMWAPLKGDPRFEAIKNDPRNTKPLY